MALEAARQITDPTMVIKGYRLSNLQFPRALQVSSAPDGVETQLHLHPLRGVGKTSKEYDFALHCHTDSEWSIVCRGSIAVEFFEKDMRIENFEETDCEQSALCDTFARGIEACKEPVNGEKLYNHMAHCGYEYGPAHQVLEDIWYSRAKEAKATIDLDGWAAKVTADPIMPHIIHPTALDGVIQLAIVVFSQGGSKPSPTMIPTTVRSMWVSNSFLNRPKGAKLEAYAKKTFQGYREADYWMAAFSGEDAQIVIDDWRQMAVSNLELTATKQNETRRLCYNFVWQPDIAMLSPDQKKEQCEAEAAKVQKPPKISFVELELATSYYISNTIEALGHGGLESLPATHSKYVEWMKRSSKRPKHVHDAKSQQSLFEKVARSSAHGALIVAVGENLVQILRGESDPLELLFGGSLARNFYHGDQLTGSYAKMAAYIDLMAHKNPNLKILEIGAGTGAATSPILQSLWSRSDTKEESTVPRFKQYDFTDLSPNFFEKAREAYKGYGESVNYRTLNIENDPLHQGFQAQHYDVVVGSMVSRLCRTSLIHAFFLTKC